MANKYSKYSTEEKREYAMNQQKALEEELEQGIKDLYSSDKWKEMLDFSKNFRNYSLNNQLLIAMQYPEATYVAGFSKFKQMNIQVNEGAKAIKIFAPSSYTREMEYEKIKNTSLDTQKVQDSIYLDEEGREMCSVPFQSFRVVNVFDISQTNGMDKIPQLVETLDYDLSNFDELVDVLSNTTTASIVFKETNTDSTLSNAYGYFRPSTNEIVVRSDMSEADKIKTLVHEIAHSNLHGQELLVEGIEDTSLLKGRDMKEIQAESVAYIVCKELGIDSSTRSFAYIGEYAYTGNEKDSIEKLKQNLEVVMKCKDKILTELDTYTKEKTELESGLEEEQEEEMDL